MVLTLLSMGLAALAVAPRAIPAGEPIKLYSTALVGDPAEEVLYVFADLGREGDEFHVLSHRKTLGSFRVAGTEVATVPDPNVKPPAVLGSTESWVFSRNSIGTSSFAQGKTTYHSLLPGNLDATRPEAWGVLASGDGTALFFVRGGSEIENPAELAVVDQDGERLVLRTQMLPRIQSSEDGDVFLLQTGTSTLHRLDGSPPTPLPPGGAFYLQPAARWVVHERESGIELRHLRDGQVVPIPASIEPPLMTVKFEGGYVLLVARTRAELFDLDSGDPGMSLLGLDAVAGHRFSSAALQRRGSGGLPRIALGELAERVPQMVLPNSPEPLATAVVSAVDQSGEPVERWSFDITAWRGTTPLVQWSKEGRLVASTRDRVLVSSEPIQ